MHNTVTFDEYLELKQQVEHLQGRVNSKTETIVRLGKDLEVSEEANKAKAARVATLERNLTRVEKDLGAFADSEVQLIAKHKYEWQKLSDEKERQAVEVRRLQELNSELQAEKSDLQKDCKLFRQQIARYEVHKLEDQLDEDNSRKTTTSKENLHNYEKLHANYKKMEADLNTMLDAKEELIKERDILLQKVERLTSELSYLLNGDPKRVGEDLDTLFAENRFLKAQLSSAQEESETIKSTLAKYRMMAENRPAQQSKSECRSGGTLDDKSDVAVVNMKQIRELLQSQAIDLDDSDYRAICSILLDVCNDKQMALTHLRRANKVLGGRLHEVEGHLAACEMRTKSASPRPDDTYSTSS